VSDVNFTGYQTVPNLVVVKLAPNGAFSLAAATPDATHAIIDVSATTPPATAPRRRR
jgi:hypothetical protein